MQSAAPPPQHPTQQTGVTGGPQFEQFQKQASSLAESAQSRLSNMSNWLVNCIQNSADTLRVYVNNYPPLAAYLFTLLVMSSVPISIYLIFGLVSALVLFSIASVGFAIVEGFMLFTGGGILLAVLGTIAFVVSIFFGWISLFYIGYRIFVVTGSRIWENLPPVQQYAQSAMHSIQQSAQPIFEQAHETFKTGQPQGPTGQKGQQVPTTGSFTGGQQPQPSPISSVLGISS